LLPIVWLGIGLAFCQQSNGINVILYYGEVLWKTVGFTEKHVLFINVLMGGALILATLTAMALIDRVGRRPLLISGSVGMILMLGIMTAIFASGNSASTGQLSLSPRLAVVALVAAHIFIFCYGASWAPVTWVLLGEMFPNRIRGGGIAIGGSTIWLTNFVVTLTFPVLLGRIGLAHAYGLYTVFTVASLFFVVRWVRETKGKTLEAMGSSLSATVEEAV
jgi:SP family sugar:H+ symporter-like MFS transporter